MGAGKGGTRRARASAAVRPGADEPTVDDHGDKEWRVDGKKHRIGGPAVEDADGHKEWWVNGQKHREDGPAVEYTDGSKIWFVDGRRHRVGGPAVAGADGGGEWWVHGKLHRVDGPAAEYADGHKEWHVDGIELTEAEFDELASTLRRDKAREATWAAAEEEIATNPEYRDPFGS